ncbi:MAG: peptidase family protein [Thermoleophilia bacterium]|nr:peptidase family protein [Thermoleophilia bacterium]
MTSIPTAVARPIADVRTFNGQLGSTPVRQGNQPPTGDVSLDAAHDNAVVGVRYFQEVLGRNSIDGAGGVVNVVAHDQYDPGNAHWDGSAGALGVGDGDPGTLRPFGHALDVIVHEMSHGVIENTSPLAYDGQPGALNESFADVFGETAEQWHENRADFGTVEGARRGGWLIGEDVVESSFGKAVRNMAEPGTAFYESAWGTDPQVGHMDDFIVTDEDFGGVHMNSGIPNKAAHGAALQIGSEKVARVWYDALTTRLHENSDFNAAALATVESARELYGPAEANAVRDGWKAVGLPRDEA